VPKPDDDGTAKENQVIKPSQKQSREMSPQKVEKEYAPLSPGQLAVLSLPVAVKFNNREKYRSRQSNELAFSSNSAS
jgi:hypothetical protein